MVLYAAADQVWVGVSVDAHGGCGRKGGHGRPVENGAPVRIWALDCPPCENHLRHDPKWAPTISQIPETYDEKIQREDFDKRGVLDERRLMAMALARLTGLDLPETLAAAIGGTPHVQVALCRDGHANSVSVKFCGECGVSMAAPQQAVTVQDHAAARTGEWPLDLPPAATARPVPESSVNARKPRWRDMRLDQLAALAREKDLDDTGPKSALIARLKAVA
jgi:hypothetical protein